MAMGGDVRTVVLLMVVGSVPFWLAGGFGPDQ